jgi:hypothetical protein
MTARLGAMALATLAAIVVIIFVVSFLDPASVAAREQSARLAMAQRAELAPLWTIVKRVGLASLAGVFVGGGIGGLAILALGGLALGLRFLRGLLLVWPRNGLYPATAGMRIWPPVNEPHAQSIAALVGGQVNRLPAGAVKPLLNPATPAEALLPEPPPAINVTPQQILEGYDPQREPHWFVIGQTGGGISRAVMYLAEQIAQRYPSEFLICERGGIDWNAQSDARTVEGYATLLETVEEERQYRVGLLRANDVDHVLRLNEPLPLLVVVIEEAENIHKRLIDIDRPRAKRYETTLQDIAGLGRKQGIVLIVATPTGTSSVFDGPTRRNLGNTLIFRSEAIVGDQWGVPRSVNLPTLPSGTAYSTKYGCTVDFPLVARPLLPKSRLYHEPDDLVVSDAIARLDDDPTTVATAANRQNGGGYQPVAPVVRLETGREPTPEEAAAMREQYKRTPSKTSVCRQFYGYKDGVTFDYVTAALEGRI